MRQHDDDDDDSEEAERKGVPPFHISTNPSENVKVPKKAPPNEKKRPNSVQVLSHRVPHMSSPRSISSPIHVRSTTPVIEEPARLDCEDICAGVKTLKLGASTTDFHGSRRERGITSGKEENPFVKPKKSKSHLPQPTPNATPIKQQPLEALFWPVSTTPRKQPQAPYLSRFTNDRCPDFYNERMEAMEREFRVFKEKMEGDVEQATDYKESINQLKMKGVFTHSIIVTAIANTMLFSHRIGGHPRPLGAGEQRTRIRTG